MPLRGRPEETISPSANRPRARHQCISATHSLSACSGSVGPPGCRLQLAASASSDRATRAPGRSRGRAPPARRARDRNRGGDRAEPAAHPTRRAAPARTGGRSRAAGSAPPRRVRSATTSDLSTSEASRSRISRALEPVAGAHRLGGVEREAAGEDRQAAKQHPLGVVQQIVAPVHRGAQRLWRGQRVAAPPVEQPEAVVEAARRSARPTASAPAQRPARSPAGCRPARGRSAPRAGVLVGRARSRGGTLRARSTNRRTASRPLRVAPCELLRERERRHAPVALAREAERRPARGQNRRCGQRPEQGLGQPAPPRRGGARSCRARPTPGVAARWAQAACSAGLPRQRTDPERLGQRRPTSSGSGQRRELDPPEPHRETPSTSASVCSASRVLPQPPAPGQRQQPRRPERLAQLRELSLTADEARQRSGRLFGTAPGGRSGRKSSRRSGCDPPLTLWR